MELSLERQDNSLVRVACDADVSHEFDPASFLPRSDASHYYFSEVSDNPLEWGTAIFGALFPANSLAKEMLELRPDRILLVITDSDLQAVPWEYAYFEDHFLVADCAFVRGLPVIQRIDVSNLDDGLEIVAVPSAPLDRDTPTLNIDGEWQRLKENVEAMDTGVRLARVRPPTVEASRSHVANRRNLVIHFMGHGGLQEGGTVGEGMTHE